MCLEQLTVRENKIKRMKRVFIHFQNLYKYQARKHVIVTDNNEISVSVFIIGVLNKWFIFYVEVEGIEPSSKLTKNNSLLTGLFGLFNLTTYQLKN